MNRYPDDLTLLLRRCGHADHEAFTQLYDATCARVYGLVLDVVGEDDPAESITRDSYDEVWRTSARLSDEQHDGMAWLLAIAHRRAVDHLRASGGAGRQHRSTPETGAGEAHVAGGGAAWARLSRPQRQALRLAYLEGCDCRAISQRVGRGVAQVRQDLREGLQTLAGMR